MCINNVYNVTNRIPFFGGKLFKNNNHGTIQRCPRFKGWPSVMIVCLISARVEFGKVWVQKLHFLGLITTMKTYHLMNNDNDSPFYHIGKICPAIIEQY